MTFYANTLFNKVQYIVHFPLFIRLSRILFRILPCEIFLVFVLFAKKIISQYLLNHQEHQCDNIL